MENTPNLTWRVAYSMLMLLAVISASWLVRRKQKQILPDPSDRLAIGLAAFVGAMLGAKLPFVMQQGWAGLLSGTTWFADGKTILGGIFGGYLAVELVKRWSGIQVRTGDSFALPVAVAVAMGRLACFAVGCCYGEVTDLPWGLEFRLAQDPPSVLRHPTQLYEVAFHTLAGLLLLVADRKRVLVGHQLKAYLLAYLFYRFCTEWIRPESRWYLGLTLYQYASVLLAVILIGLWLWDRKEDSDRSRAVQPQAASETGSGESSQV
jgi:prolipoprotein diacylglyceryltransferase